MKSEKTLRTQLAALEQARLKRLQDPHAVRTQGSEWINEDFNFQKQSILDNFASKGINQKGNLKVRCMQPVTSAGIRARMDGLYAT